MKNLLDFFYYTKAERKACVLLLILCSLAFVLPEWLDFSPHYKLEMLENAPKAVQAKRAWPQQKRKAYPKRVYSHKYPTEGKRTVAFASFDPNTVSLKNLLDMGLNQRSANIWIKYLSKGGRFKKGEDVLKIYGLPENWYQKAKPYLQIQSTHDSVPEKPQYRSSFQEPWPKSKPKTCTPIDINTADTAAWQSLRGIGKVLASRIVKFREKLGGFYALEQVGGAYGLADSVFQKIQPCLQLGQVNLKPLLINQASFNELASHPYLGFKAAKAILTWKDQHGPFGTIEDLEAIITLDRQQLLKVKPYLQF